MVYDEESATCNERTWVWSLMISSAVSSALGFVIFGLSLGTIKNPVFVHEVWSFLEPTYKIACADIACGVFICVAGGLGCCAVAYNHPLFSRIYSLLLVLLFTFQLSIGIATIIISDEETEFLRAITILICVNPELKNTNLRANTGVSDGVLPSLDEMLTNSEAKRFPNRLSDILMPEASPLDRLFAQQAFPPMTLQECNYFVNLATPCGSLLICGAVLYMYMLYCIVCLRDHYLRHEYKNKNWLKDWRQEKQPKVSPCTLPIPVASHFVPSLGSVEKDSAEIHH